MPARERVALLHRHYPDLIYSVTNNTARLMNNRTVVIDDGKRKSHLQKRRGDGDIEDQLAQIYPVGRCFKGRLHHFDPGLVRNAAFFRNAYGSTRHYVRRASETVDWFGTDVVFSSRHGAADALRRVRDEIRALPPKFHALVRRPARTLDWSTVRDTDRLSVHAYAIAIDLKPAIDRHWRHGGAKKGRVKRYRNRVPAEIVSIFERHGFIWGGKWYRYRTGHFEYRPALIAIGRLAESRGCESAPASGKRLSDPRQR